MKPFFKVDNSGLRKALKEVKMDATAMLQVEGAGAKVLVNGMRMRVPVDTAATKLSIISHITEYDAIHVVDEVGPETIYAPNIEYGIKSKPNYPIQPFVRPTAIEDFAKVIRAIGSAFGALVIGRWPR